MFSVTVLGTQSIKWKKKKIWNIFKNTQNIFLKKKKKLHAFHPTKHSFMFTKTKKSILAIVKYWPVALYLISFKRWSLLSKKVKGHVLWKEHFPFVPTKMTKGPLIDETNWHASI